MNHESHVQRELEFPAAAKFGSKNQSVKRLQEWLTLAGFGTSVDSDFGTATRESLRRFQERHGSTVGDLTETDWERLIAPMRAAIAAPTQQRFLARVRAVAQQHLRLKGREVGGANAGPWVRLYMRGRDGKDFLWCAGFVSFVLRQAALDCQDPLAEPWRAYHEISCDQLASDAKSQQRFLTSTQARTLLSQSPDALNVAVFLKRAKPKDWVHTGFALSPVIDADALRFDTVEGNTNDGGSSNGIEVAARVRAGNRYDIVRLG